MTVGWLLASLAAVASTSESLLELPQGTTQGALVIGRVATPEATVMLGERTLRISADGVFLFGLGRDDTGPVEVTAILHDGRRETRRLDVVSRQWQIQRIDGLPPQTVSPDPEVAARIAREQARVAEARRRDDARMDFRFGFVRPVEDGRISGVYGSQRILNGQPRAPHYGLDIAAPTGTPIHAPAAGIVSFADPDLFLTGGTVLIDHGHGLTSSFLHMSAIDVEVGQRVEQGTRIGAVGATGRATGPHLHWGLNWFEVRLDPGLLLQD
ncbi:MAG TPA: M23 family metallopeptidase [Xanthomonadaceae bacterium]|nr:M23 family metallopeptidase [Xanthomonadaceae bacterium]